MLLWRAFTSLLILGMMVPLMPTFPSAAMEQNPAPVSEPSSDPLPPPPGPPVVLLDEEAIQVRVVAPEGTDLSKYGHFVASRIPDPFTGLTVYYGQVSEEMFPVLKADWRLADVARIQRLAQAPNTRPDPDVTTRDRPSMEETRARLIELRENPPEPAPRPEPSGWWDVSAGGHNAVEAWVSGYTGRDVKVAVNDSGVDMAHPDFWGTEARYVNVSGDPYYDYFEGWPMALSPIANYLMAFDLEINGALTPYNTFYYPISNFADTSTTGTGDTILLATYHFRFSEDGSEVQRDSAA